ncbi:metal-dependent hydrolase [Niallia sp. MER 6]|uniref:metal-dependent hydrolase n=1 Tax=Niallia sp. MER 6 TaxID=2939567 RepID=UPI002040112A|nr:metal-dependent hydrolase [Niallia sp. MER 6]
MQYKTHLSTSLVVALGAVFPDIDEPYSWIGSRTRGISDLIKGFFGHRGLKHSLMGLFIVFLTMILIMWLALRLLAL